MAVHRGRGRPFVLGASAARTVVDGCVSPRVDETTV